MKRIPSAKLTDDEVAQICLHVREARVPRWWIAQKFKISPHELNKLTRDIQPNPRPGRDPDTLDIFDRLSTDN